LEPVLVAVIVLSASAVLQSCTGFGYAIVSAPILASLLGPAEAVSLIMVSGALVDLGLLLARGRRPAPAMREVVRLSLWSLPGLVIGAAVLAVAPDGLVEVAMVVIIIAVVLGRLVKGGAATRLADRPAAAIAGLTSGLLNTSTTLAGPPLAVYLGPRVADPWRQRDTLITISLLRLPVSVGAMIIAGSWRTPDGLIPSLIGAAVGLVVGRAIFGAMSAAAHRRTVTAVLILAAAVAVLSLIPLLLEAA
jgi:uncharacterized membrane protein YfcA